MRRFLTALALAQPMVAVIVYCLFQPPDRRGNWLMGLEVISLVTLACWGAVWISHWRRSVGLTRVPPHRVRNVFQVLPARTISPNSRRTDWLHTNVSKRLNWRSAILLLGLLPYAGYTAEMVLTPWSLQPVSSRANAAMSIGMCLLLPLLPGLFLLPRLRRGRWWLRIPAFLIIMLPVALLWRSILSDAIQCYHTGCDTDPNLIERFPTVHGTLLVYTVPSDPLSADGARVVQEQILRYGLKRTRILYYRDGGHDVSLRLIDADHVAITAQSPYADQSTPLSVIRSLR